MRVKIEDYRGFEIFFDTESEEFYTVSNREDADQKKRSFASCKKWIDDYLKENNTFKPFLVHLEVYENSPLKAPVWVKGVRKDGRFVLENGNQIGIYDESRTVIYKEGYEAIDSEIIEYKAKIKEYEEKIKDAVIRQGRVSLKVYRVQNK